MLSYRRQSWISQRRTKMVGCCLNPLLILLANHDRTIEHTFIYFVPSHVTLMSLSCHSGMTDQKRQFHWDKRHKKYVQLGAHETVKGGKRVRTESGKVCSFLS